METKKQQICPYCNRDIIGNYQRYGAHIGICKLNPNYQVAIEKRRQTQLIKSNRKDYIFNCKKCNTEYILNLTQYQYEHNKYKKY